MVGTESLCRSTAGSLYQGIMINRHRQGLTKSRILEGGNVFVYPDGLIARRIGSLIDRIVGKRLIRWYLLHIQEPGRID